MQVSVGNITLRQRRLLQVVKELIGAFLSRKYLRVTALEQVVFMKYDEETALFPICAANEFILHKIAVSYARTFVQSALSLLNQV